MVLESPKREGKFLLMKMLKIQQILDPGETRSAVGIGTSILVYGNSIYSRFGVSLNPLSVVIISGGTPS